jgi:hypothetical protein
MAVIPWYAIPRPTIATNTLIGRLGIAMFVIATVLLSVHFIAFLSYAIAAVQYPFELDYGEGIVWQQAMLIPGKHMYGDIRQYPFIVFHYPPVYHLTVRALATLGLDVLVAGRGLSLLSSFTIGAFAAALAFEAVRYSAGRLASWMSALIAGLSIFCFWPVVVWSPMMRVDMMAIAFSFAGIWLAVRSTSRPRLLYFAAALFVLAVFTKQTCVAAPLATMPVLLINGRLPVVRACCLGLLFGGAALLYLSWLTDGGFLRHVLLYNLNRYSVHTAALALWYERGHLFFLVLAIAAAFVGWKRVAVGQGGSGLTSLLEHIAAGRDSRVMAILILYFAISTGMLATLGKSGGSLNYLIEWMCVASVLIGTLAATIVERELSRIRLGPSGSKPLLTVLIPAALLLVQVLVAPAGYDFGGSDLRTMQARAQLVERISAADKPVLSDDMVLLMKAGKQVPWEPAIFAELTSMGLWDERLIVDMISSHRFAFIVTRGHRGAPLYDSRYTPSVDQAIQDAYPRSEENPAGTLHFPPG